MCSRHWVGDTTAVMPGQTTCEMHNRWNCPTTELNFTRDRRPGFWTLHWAGHTGLCCVLDNREKMRQSILSSLTMKKGFSFLSLLFVESTGLVSIFCCCSTVFVVFHSFILLLSISIVCTSCFCFVVCV